MSFKSGRDADFGHIGVGWRRISGIRLIFPKRECPPYEYQMGPTECEESR